MVYTEIIVLFGKRDYFNGFEPCRNRNKNVMSIRHSAISQKYKIDTLYDGLEILLL
jgi:hypothetical protein